MRRARSVCSSRALNIVTTDAPSDVEITADFGSHCPEAVFSTSGALVIDSDILALDATGILYFEYRPSGPFSSAGGGLGVIVLRSADPIVEVPSSVNGSRTLFTVRVLGSIFLVDGTPLSPANTFRSTFTTSVHAGAGTWNVTEEYSMTNLGPTPIAPRTPGLCA